MPPTKILFSFTIKESDIHSILVKNMFTGFNKAGQDIKLCNILFYRNVGNKPCCNFNGLILTVKTNKNLNSTTYLQTDIRFLGINMSDEPNLPKIELPNLSTKKINTYSNNPNVAEKLASPVLCDTLTNLKNLFQVPQAQVIFYNEYVIFVLGSGFEMHKFFPLDMSLFRRFDISKAGKAIINFKTLYDLTNKIEYFTKNI